MKFAVAATRASSAALLLAALAMALPAPAAAQELNLYSSRHYQTDEALYNGFTEQTGIRINRIEDDADKLIARLQAEGVNSPADVFITVDAGRIWRADAAGLLQPVRSEILEERIPASLRDPEGKWFGVSRRARVIYYDRERVDPALFQTYEDLARPEAAGLVCIRSSDSIYQLSLLASMIEHHGADAAREWARKVVANMARPPTGNDTAQLRAIASGECGLALANTYYFVRLMNSDSPEDQAVVDRVGVIFPNQEDRGTHVNISAAGVAAHAPNREAAVQFLEYLAGPEAQRHFAAGNNEYTADGDAGGNEALASLGTFKADELNVRILGERQPEAQRLYDEAGWR